MKLTNRIHPCIRKALFILTVLVMGVMLSQGFAWAYGGGGGDKDPEAKKSGSSAGDLLSGYSPEDLWAIYGKPPGMPGNTHKFKSTDDLFEESLEKWKREFKRRNKWKRGIWESKTKKKELPPPTEFIGPVTAPKEKKKYKGDIWKKQNITKPDHWSDKQWKKFLREKRDVLDERTTKAHNELSKADRNYKVSVGVGVGAAIASGGVGAAAAGTSAAAGVTAAAVVGDGLAAGAGELAEGKSVKEAMKSTVKKSLFSAAAGKLETGSKLLNAGAGLASNHAYDNSPGKLSNMATNPDYVSPGDVPTSHSAMTRTHTIMR